MATNYERIEALARLVREKGLSRDILIESLLFGLQKATEREYGTAQEISINWDESRDDIDVVILKTVVDVVEQGKEHLQISGKKARKINPDIKQNQKIDIEFNFEDLNRSAVNVFRHEFLSMVRAAEREDVFEEYKDRIGQLIPRCRVQQVYKNRILVQIAGKIEAVIPAEERARGERYEQGDSVLPVLIRVEPPESTEAQIVLSRSDPELVKRLFEREAPEIEEGIVEIRVIAREPGIRAKIAVATNDSKVDAVGAFVGIRGSRVQSVTRELNGERIDIIPWTMDKQILVSHALQPATVIRSEMRKIENPETGEESQVMIVVIPDNELSLAIGKNGQNVRLAGNLINCVIKLKTQSEWEKENRWQEMLRVDISEIGGLSASVCERLRLAGYDSAQAILSTDRNKISEVKGIGPVSLKKIIEQAGKFIRKRKEDVERLRAEAESEESEARSREEGDSVD